MRKYYDSAREIFLGPQSIDGLANRLQSLLDEMETIIPSLKSRGKDQTLSELNPSWAYGTNNPLGPLAEMGGAGADKKINPEKHIYDLLSKFRKLVYEFIKKAPKKQGDFVDTNWQKLTIEDDIASKSISEALGYFAYFVNEIKKYNTAE